METSHNAWPEIRTALATAADESLVSLLDSSQLTYDGNYTLSADPRVYAGLCQYYPLIETVVQDLSGKHFRLSLEKSVPMGTEAPQFNLSIGASNVTDAILLPESIAAVPSYLLRFVPYVGASAVLIATALRQAFYLTSRERGADQLYPRDGDAVTIKVSGLLNTLGSVISRATFFRLFKDGSLDWFVRRSEATHRYSDGRVQREPNTYHYRGMLLTPGDAQDLYTWLQANGLSTDPVAVLTHAIEIPRDQILKFPYRTPNSGQDQAFDQPAPVHVVVQKILSKDRLNPTLAGLCDRLSSHLVRPESFLAVPWYWFKQVLPELGADLGVLYLMCKSCCYVDWARGRDRNTFWVPGGLPTLQKWIRSETLPKRIPAIQKSSRGRPREEEIKAGSEYTRSWRETKSQLASQYLCRIATRPGELGTDWQLKVQDVQLTAADETLKQAIYAFLYAPPEGLTSAALRAFSESKELQNALLIDAAHFPERLCHFETLVEQGICHSDTLTQQQICHFETLVSAVNSYFETLVPVGICNFETIIKILLRLKHASFFNPDTSTPNTGADPVNVTPQPPAVVGYFDQNGWNFDQLLARINPILKARIQQQGFEEKFLSWLIHASLTVSINSPLSLAVSRTLESGTDAGGPALALARLPAGELAEGILEACHRLESGYLGHFSTQGSVSPLLSVLLKGVESNQQQLRLLQRLADALRLSNS